jgi:hypothetical protein
MGRISIFCRPMLGGRSGAIAMPLKPLDALSVRVFVFRLSIAKVGS